MWAVRYFRDMYYVIDKSRLWELIDEETSKVADSAYFDDGTPLYDSVVLTEKDRSTVGRFIDDAVSAFVKREFDVTKYAPLAVHSDEDPSVITSVIPRLEFYAPDFDETMAASLDNEIDRYITMFVCSSLYQQRRAALVPEYTTRTQSSMDKAVSILKSRKHPVTKW